MKQKARFRTIYKQIHPDAVLFLWVSALTHDTDKHYFLWTLHLLLLWGWMLGQIIHVIYRWKDIKTCEYVSLFCFWCKITIKMAGIQSLSVSELAFCDPGFTHAVVWQQIRNRNLTRAFAIQTVGWNKTVGPLSLLTMVRTDLLENVRAVWL